MRSPPSPPCQPVRHRAGPRRARVRPGPAGHAARARDLGGVGRLLHAWRSRCRWIRRPSSATLPNGLRYYVRPNGKPARRAELRLVVKAGSVLEDDDQQGLAHFVEHMEFEGTRHFPGSSINDFLASLGLSIGADANAATSYDDTQYTLRVPTDVPGALDRALLVLEDWAQARDVRSARRSSGSAASCSPSGGCTSAPASGPRTSSGACSSRDRATPIARRSASPRSSRTRSASSCCASIATGTART